MKQVSTSPATGAQPTSELTPKAELGERLAALAEAAELARYHLPDEDVNGVLAVTNKAVGRMRHGTSHTVVAIAGATGSGKSTIVNRLAGSELSESGVRRPTTSTTHAAVWGSSDAGPLLDWFEVQRRHKVEGNPGALDGLVLLDLPDHDSTAVEHRLEVDRLVELVDILIWVTDPQKYADEALHVGYLQQLTSHAQVFRFVLNQIDLLANPKLVTADFRKLLQADGIGSPQVLALSAATGEGFEALEDLLAATVSDQRAAIDRLNADIGAAAAVLRRSGGKVETKGQNRKKLISRLGDAAGATQIASVAAAHHKRKGILKMGWPFTRFIRRLGRRPLADIPGPGRAPAAEAQADLAIRDYAEEVAQPLESPWPTAIRKAVSTERSKLLDELRSVVGSAAIGSSRLPIWWSVIAWLQGLFAGAAVIGLGWLLIVAILGGFFRFDTEPLLPETPNLEWIPIPSALLIAGATLGLLTGLLVRLPLRAAAARRGRQARKAVETAVEKTADTKVIAPIEQLVAQQVKISELLDVAANH